MARLPLLLASWLVSASKNMSLRENLYHDGQKAPTPVPIDPPLHGGHPFRDWGFEFNGIFRKKTTCWTKHIEA